MNFVLQPWQMLFAIVIGWVNEYSRRQIDYLHMEVTILKETFGTKRPRLTNDQRRRLAAKGKVLGRKGLAEIGSFFSPDTILRWHRQLIAEKWTFPDDQKPVGRPTTSKVIVDLILQWAKENPTWGYDRIADSLANVGYHISDQTVGNILKGHGIEPVPKRKAQITWGTFLKAHWEQLAAIDFTTVEVWTTKGLVTYYLLFAMKLSSRKVEFLGSTTNPTGPWIEQIARNLTDAFDGFLREPIRYVLMDRDTKFTAKFKEILQSSDVKPVVLPPRSPNCNAYIERFFRSLKSETLSRMIFFGEKAMLNAVREFLAHYHGERFHQGVGHRLLEAGPEAGQSDGVIDCRERLGGVLKYYHRRAA